jgi:hypothetical protein
LDALADELRFDYLRFDPDKFLGPNSIVIADLIPRFLEEQLVSQQMQSSSPSSGLSFLQKSVSEWRELLTSKVLDAPAHDFGTFEWHSL